MNAYSPTKPDHDLYRRRMQHLLVTVGGEFVCLELLRDAMLLDSYLPLSVSSSPAECPFRSCRSARAGDLTRVFVVAAGKQQTDRFHLFLITMSCECHCPVTVRLRRTSLSLCCPITLCPFESMLVYYYCPCHVNCSL